MQKAEKLFGDTFMTCNSKFAVIYSFKQISQLGLPSASIDIYDQYISFADELFNDPKNDDLFTDKEGTLKALGSVEALGEKIAKEQIQKYKASVDAASLIFAHSVIDAAALNYCQCSFLASPMDWEQFVEKRKMTIEEIKGKKFDDILSIKVDAYIKSLDRESLLTKAERLFQICKPTSDFSPILNFTYDRDRLQLLDNMRHDIVHESGSVPNLPNGENDIVFLQKTANFFMALINSKYGLKLDTSFITNRQKR